MFQRFRRDKFLKVFTLAIFILMGVSYLIRSLRRDERHADVEYGRQQGRRAGFCDIWEGVNFNTRILFQNFDLFECFGPC